MEAGGPVRPGRRDKRESGSTQDGSSGGGQDCTLEG